MKKLLALLLSLSLLFSLCACSVKEMAAEYLPDQETLENLFDSGNDNTGTAYYESHTEIPDFGVLFGYTLYAKTPQDGFDYYYYQSKTDNLTTEFAALRNEYAALCTTLGHTPDYSVSGSLSLFVRFDSEAALLAVAEDYICLIAAPITQLENAMDSMSGTSAEAVITSWKQLYAQYAAAFSAGLAQIPDTASADAALASLGEDYLSQSLNFFEAEDPRQAFRDAGYALEKVSMGTGYGLPYIEGTNARGDKTRFSLQYDIESMSAFLQIKINGTIVMSVSFILDGTRCVKQIYDAENNREIRVWIEAETLALGVTPAESNPDALSDLSTLTQDNFIKACRSYEFYE